MVRLVALLSWFDEQPGWLAACVSSLVKADVDHLVAVDGAYALYPDSMRVWRSPLEQIEAVVGTAYGLGVGLTLHQPRDPWFGNEVEKRNLMFDLARQQPAYYTDDDTWFLIIDGDEMISEARDVKGELERTPEDVAYYRLVEPDGTPNAVRGLYRNHPDLHIRKTHYGYSHGDQLLWDGGGRPAGNLTDHLVLEHRLRTGRREDAKWEYYRAREETQIERVP